MTPVFRTFLSENGSRSTLKALQMQGFSILPLCTAFSKFQKIKILFLTQGRYMDSFIVKQLQMRPHIPAAFCNPVQILISRADKIKVYLACNLYVLRLQVFRCLFDTHNSPAPEYKVLGFFLEVANHGFRTGLRIAVGNFITSKRRRSRERVTGDMRLVF